MATLEAAASTMADRRIEWADFDVMLQDMSVGLRHVADFFGFAATADQLGAIARGPLMQRYSKALEYEYSPTLRNELISDASRRHRSEIADALAMLHAASEKSDLLARALSRAEG
jgi:hypothetical protein